MLVHQNGKPEAMPHSWMADVEISACGNPIPQPTMSFILTCWGEFISPLTASHVPQATSIPILQ